MAANSTLRRAVVAALLAWQTCVTAGPARAAPQSFNTALPVGQQQWLVRAQLVHFRGDIAAAGETEALGALSLLGYGITADLTAFAALPVLHKRLEPTAAPAREETGIGDLRLFGRYTIFKRDFPGATFRVAPFAGAELPTGRNRAGDRFGLLPPRLQPGSGAVDPFFGAIATYQSLSLAIDAQLAYQVNRKADGFAFGDIFRADLSGQYRIWPRELGAGTPGFLYLALEANYADFDTDRRRGVRIAGSGGEEFLLSPGLQYVTRRWVAEALVQIPVARDLGPFTIADDLRLRAGLRFTF